MDQKEKTCCFTGHRNLPEKKIEHIIKRLNDETDELIRHGVTDFISGGAFGFDLIAASLIISKKEMGAGIRLIFALPCRNQDENWISDQKLFYYNLISEADEVRYISEEYSPGCMKKRNHYMVDNSGHCICALLREKSGTAQTVNFARKNGLHIINVAK